MTIQGLINKIFKANQTPSNTVSWSGVNGLKTIQEDIVDTIRQRTFFTVPTTADLVNQGFNNAVLCYVQDHAFFRWQATGIPNGTTIFPANDGGVWKQETIGDTDGTVTSIGLSMPAAFTVANSPVTTNGVIGVTAAGTSAQYIKGDGTLGTLPTPTGGTVTNVSALSIDSLGTDLSSTVSNPTTTPVITLSVPTASAVNRGVLSPADWTTFNNKQNAITLTTSGTSGAATLVGSTLNIPQYQSVLTNPVTGTGTADYLPKWTSSSAIGNSLIYDNGTNIGIGTNSPNTYLTSTQGLVVYSVGVPSLALATSPANTWTNYLVTNQYRLYHSTNGVLMTVVSNGNVLIGTTTDSGYKLDVNGTTRLQNTLTVLSSITWGSTGGGRLTFAGSDAYMDAALSGGSLILRTNGSTTAMKIFSTQNVGIGTTTDAGYKLDVAGTAKVSGISYLIGGLLVSNYGSTIAGGQSISGSGAGNYDFNNGSGGGWYFNWIQNGATAMRLSSGNNLLIGTTTDAGYKLDVNGTGRVQTSITIGGAADGTLFFPNTTSGHQMRIYTQYASNAMVLYANGYNLNLNGAGSMTSNFCTTITGSNGSAALTVQQGNVAWSPVLVVNAIGSTGTRFNTNGNVLIGTTTDAGYKLDVIGTIRSKDPGSNSNIVLTYGTGGWLQIFDTTPTETIRLRAGGGASYINTGQNVLIGTTTDSGYKLDVYGTLRILSGNGSRIEGGGSFTATGFCNFNGAAQSVAGTNCGLLNVQSNLSVGYQGATVASAVVEIRSTTQGVLLPRMTDTQILAIASPANGLMVYSTTQNVIAFYDGTGWHKVTHTNL